MRRFLQETWELFYWALWCPSSLQKRMHEWSGRRKTDFWDILLFRFHLRFFSQFLTIIGCLSLPLVIVLSQGSSLIDWLLVPLAGLISYGVACWDLPAALPIPLLITLSYTANPDLLLEGVHEAFKLVPLVSKLTTGLGIGLVGVGITAITAKILQNTRIQTARWFVVVGNTLSGVLGSWFASQNWIVTFAVGGAIAVLSFLSRDDLQDLENELIIAPVAAIIVTTGVAIVVATDVARVVTTDVAFIVASLVAFVVAFLVAFAVVGSGVKSGVRASEGSGVGVVVRVGAAIATTIVTEIVAIVIAAVVAAVMAAVVAVVAQFSLVLFLLTSGVASISLYPYWQPREWLRVSTTMISMMILLGEGNLGWQVGWVIPVVLITYHRIFPDYVLLLVLQLPSLLWIKRFSRTQSLSQLHRLPPHTSELLWWPLPGHAQLLINAFRHAPQSALPTFEQMATFSLPGFQRTITQALPQIIADQFIAVQSPIELQRTASSDHPLLPILVPTFYQSEPNPNSITSLPSDVSVLVPKFQNIAAGLSAVLEASNAALRERGLERIINNLLTLQAQLPGLGLKTVAIQRWQPVIQRWQNVIQLELEEQRKLSQGELLNPFQFGNPLRRDRADLFKGRRAFVDQVYRLVLDRNRPTLVLHGPRRCGKSSFLLNLSRWLPSDIIPVYLDMQRSGFSSSEADFCYGLAKAIHDDSRSQSIQMPALPKRDEFRQNPYPVLEDWLDEALGQLGDRRLLLNFDEFEKIGSAIQAGRLSLRLFDELRSLIQHTDQLGFLFSGVQTLNELGPNWSSYFISVVPMEMLYLEPRESEDLLINPDPEFALRYEAEVIPVILQLTRCQPYLLQLIGSALVTQANLQHTQMVTLTLLQAAIQDAFTQGEPYFTNVWTEFTGTSLAEVAMGQAYLFFLAGRSPTPPDLSSPDTQAALRRLHRYHVIEAIDGRDRIEIPLFEQWVRERAIAE